MLKKPTLDEAEAYHKSITQNLPLEVRYLGENKGFGLFATEDIASVSYVSDLHLIFKFRKKMVTMQSYSQKNL